MNTPMFCPLKQPVSALRILVGGDYQPNPNSGAAGTMYQMNRALRQLGHQVDEIWSSDMSHHVAHGNLHHLLELPWTFRKAVKSRMKRDQFDVVELHQPHVYPAAAWLQRHYPSTVVINRSHGHEVRVAETLKKWGVAEPRSKSGVRRVATALLSVLLHRHWDSACRYSDGFHVSSSDDSEFLSSRYGVEEYRIGLISQGIPSQFLEPSIPHGLDSDRARRLIYIGQFAPFKGPGILGAVVSSVLQRLPDVTMTWICSAAHHHVAGSILAPKILSRVRFLDWMPQNELVQHLDEHGVFLFPSLCEGFGKAPLEAMSRGLCVVASETGGMRDYIQHEQNGLLFPVGNEKAMEQQVMKLLCNPQFAASISKSARETAVQHTWANCAEKLVEFYRSLIARKRSTT